MNPQPNREALILSHMPQVELLPRSLHRRCPRVGLDDLIQAGAIGLSQAINRFDPTRNRKSQFAGLLLGLIRAMIREGAEGQA
jgi:DNA-directed RNA polymerase specialized sigma subunit